MKTRFFLALIASVSLAAHAGSPAQELKPALVKRCVTQGLEFHAHSDYVHTYCDCSWTAISETLTVAEYVQLDAAQTAKTSLQGMPFMGKLLPKLKACREQAAKVHTP